MEPDGYPSLLVRTAHDTGAWHFDGQRWIASSKLLAGLELEGKAIFTSRERRDTGVRLRDLDADGVCELIVSNPTQQAVFGPDARQGWKKLPFALPEGTTIADAEGRDAGLRFVDIDQDGYDDVLFSNETGYSAHLFVSRDKGWSHKLVSGKRSDSGALPMIARAGTNNGAWVHDRKLWVQNEDTDTLPDLVERKPLDDLLKEVLFPGPKSPGQSLALTQVRPGFQVELAVSEPLVTDPVSMAWGPDGKLWVVEMGDYPRGIDDQGKSGGVVRYLEDSDGDGRYDKSTVFLDDLEYPNSLTPWRNGVEITCAPDILYAEDTDGDGKADKREILYSGFDVGNPQYRMNGIKWGMDGWLYCAHGDAAEGGELKMLKTGEKTLSGKIEPTGSLDRYQEIRGGEIELPSGAQQIVFRSSGPVQGSLLQLGGILLKPAPAAK